MGVAKDLNMGRPGPSAPNYICFLACAPVTFVIDSFKVVTPLFQHVLLSTRCVIVPCRFGQKAPFRVGSVILHRVDCIRCKHNGECCLIFNNFFMFDDNSLQ